MQASQAAGGRLVPTAVTKMLGEKAVGWAEEAAAILSIVAEVEAKVEAAEELHCGAAGCVTCKVMARGGWVRQEVREEAQYMQARLGMPVVALVTKSLEHGEMCLNATCHKVALWHLPLFGLTMRLSLVRSLASKTSCVIQVGTPLVIAYIKESDLNQGTIRLLAHSHPQHTHTRLLAHTHPQESSYIRKTFFWCTH